VTVLPVSVAFEGNKQVKMVFILSVALLCQYLLKWHLNSASK